MRAKTIPFRTNDPNVNYHALADIEGMPNMSDEATHRAFKDIFRRYGATEQIVEVYPNGIARIRIVDHDGRTISEYHDTPDHVGQYTK